VQCLVRRGRAENTDPRPATCPAHSGEAHASSGRFSGTERQTPHPHLALCDTHHRPVLKGFSMLGENTLQRVIHAVGMHIAQAKRDHTGQPAPLAATNSPKPRSWTSIIRSSWRAFSTMPGSGNRSSPCSARCTASCPRLWRKATVLGEMPISARNFTGGLAPTDGLSPPRARPHSAGPGEYPLVPDKDRHR
jgi:hypothetical protein